MLVAKTATRTKSAENTIKNNSIEMKICENKIKSKRIMKLMIILNEKWFRTRGV
jgi:hypothetical protein